MIEVVMYSLSFCFFIFLRKIELLQTPSSFDPPNNQISTFADCKVQTKSCEESLWGGRTLDSPTPKNKPGATARKQVFYF